MVGQQKTTNQKVVVGENVNNMSNILQEEVSKIRKMMLLEDLVQDNGTNKLKDTLSILKKKKKVLLLSCSNRFNWDEAK